MLKTILNVKNTRKLSKQDQKIVNGGARIPGLPCGGTGGKPINKPQSRCFGYGIVWHNGVCWGCY